MGRGGKEGNGAADASVRSQPVAVSALTRTMEVIRPEPLRRRAFVRLLFLLITICLTIACWQMMKEVEARQLKAGLKTLASSLESRWAETNLKAFGPIRSLCDDIDDRRVVTPLQFAGRATALTKNADLYEAVYWISRDGKLKAASADQSGEELALPLGADPAMWQSAGAGGAEPIVGPVYDGAYGRSLFAVCYPLGADGKAGMVLAIIRLGRLMERFADSELRDLVSIDLTRNDRVMYSTGNYMTSRNPQLRQLVKLGMLNQVWMCQITPTMRFIRQYDSQGPNLVLIAGSVGCLLAGVSALSAMKRRWQHTMLEKGHVQIIDIVGELTRSISLGRRDSSDALLQIVETARPITDSDAVAVYEFAQNRKQLELVCASSEIPLKPVIELDWPTADSLRTASEGRLTIIDSQHSELLQALNQFNGDGLLRSGVIAPLLQNRVIGVVLYASTTRTPWTGGRLALVKLWTSQTTALLGDEAIHTQMRDALAVQEKLARRREMMLTLLGEIYQAGSTEQTLGRIAQLSPHSLGVEACVVALRTRKEGELEIVAATGELGVRYFGVRLKPSVEQLMKLFKPDSVAVIEPAELEEAGFSKVAEPWLAGLAAIPMLHSDGRPIGCLLLMSSNQQAFTPDQLDLARVLASRASAAIENAQLNHQIRQDAETRAMLLRELNHRVKNNLAGIVGLLSMSSTMEMPRNVRQWLDRVIERIGNIARAHELFSGGIQAVSLAQLVEQVIPSLAVVKPPAVMICKELGSSEIWLKTTQAVSLAMVIHELCYNAIVHGLGARGTLTIRAQVSENRNVILEIIDDGTAGTVQAEDDGSIATMAPPVSSTGLGLRLVKGLVGRELRGRFTMKRRQEGGTVVAVEFPLERDRE